MTQGVPFNPRRITGTVNPPTGGAHFEQRGRDGYTRLYGVGPDYPRVFWSGADGSGGALIGDDIKKVVGPSGAKKRGRPPKTNGSRKPANKAAEQKPTGRFAKMKKSEDYPISLDDLAEWGRGNQEIDFAPDLSEALEHHFDRVPVDESEAGLIVVEQGVLTADELAEAPDPAEDEDEE